MVLSQCLGKVLVPIRYFVNVCYINEKSVNLFSTIQCPRIATYFQVYTNWPLITSLRDAERAYGILFSR